VDIAGTGLAVSSANVELARIRIDRTVPDALGDVGAGLQVNSDHGYPSEVTVNQLLVRHTRAAAVGVFGSRVAFNDVAILDVQAKADGTFGDGIALASVAFNNDRDDFVDATITRALVRGAARAAIALFGGTVRLEQSVLCSPIDINIERGYAYALDGTTREREVVLEDHGGNVCGCGAPAACLARSAGLSPLRK
jgi:hypothetical protein